MWLSSDTFYFESPWSKYGPMSYMIRVMACKLCQINASLLRVIHLYFSWLPHFLWHLYALCLPSLADATKRKQSNLRWDSWTATHGDIQVVLCGYCLGCRVSCCNAARTRPTWIERVPGCWRANIMFSWAQAWAGIDLWLKWWLLSRYGWFFHSHICSPQPHCLHPVSSILCYFGCRLLATEVEIEPVGSLLSDLNPSITSQGWNCPKPLNPDHDSSKP